MGLNGNRFKVGPGRQPCPQCHGYPPLVNVDGRFVPTCDTRGGQGSVRRETSTSTKPKALDE
jgi:DnaJ-class molecular chaperone